METLYHYMLLESVRELPENIKGLIVFDIDDTLLTADPSVIKVFKNKPGESQKTLTTQEYAKDPDVETNPEWFDFSEFRNPIKVYHSIVNATPKLRNLKIMDAYVNAGYDFCFLTARGCEDVIKKAIEDFLKIKDKSGNLKRIGTEYKKALSHAISDESKEYPGKDAPEAKSLVLQDLCKKYDKVVFVDDDKKNIAATKALGLKNLKVIQAW